MTKHKLSDLQLEMVQIRLEIEKLEGVPWDPEVDQGPSPAERRLALRSRMSEFIRLVRGMTRGSHLAVICLPPPLDWTSVDQAKICTVEVLGGYSLYKDPWGVERSLPLPLQVEVIQAPHLKDEPECGYISAFPNDAGCVMLAHPPMTHNPLFDPGCKIWIEQRFEENQSLKTIK